MLDDKCMGLKIGVTGGIGSGKSVVTRLFRLLNVPTYDADTAAKAIMTDSRAVRAQLVAGFGPAVYLPDGSLNRSWLSDRVFHDEKALKKLNSIVHPAVIQHGNEWAEAQSGPYSVKEAALLFESGSFQSLDYTILVSSPLELRIHRVMKRDGVSRQEIVARMDQQMPEEDKLKLANRVIYNDEKQSLITQVYNIHQQLIHDGSIH